MQKARIRGLAHITGGGITENVPRILQAGLCAEIDTGSWQQGAVFDWLAAAGRITPDEMRRTFNCGVGMVVVVAPADADAALAALEEAGETAWRLGRIASGTDGVRYI
jgi:phosphoribosylformylglycinamidine cyclo-ligase